MARLRVLVADDEPLAAERLVRLCARLEDVEIVGVAGDGLTALSQAEALAPDVLLLDISMPGLDGMALARKLTAHDRGPAIVFVTAHSRFAVEAFAQAATDYLLKPVAFDRLAQALARAAARRPPEPIAGPAILTELWVPHGRATTRVPIDAVELAEAERDYVRLYAGGTTYLIRMTLRALEERLDPNRFLRVHRSALVALDRIASLRIGVDGGWTASLSSGQFVRIGRSFRPLVRKVLSGRASDRHATPPERP